MKFLTLAWSSVAHAADAAAPGLAAVAALPWYFKILGAIGVAGFFWKLVQGNVPKVLEWLMPLALRGTDLFVALVLSYPLLRWLVLGDKDNFLATVNALLDGLEKISDAIQERLKKDLDAASAGTPPPPAPGGSAPPTSPPPAP